MARRVNEKEYDARRKAILDAALRLVYSRGYENMTIQDLLDELSISKGAFYHYFDSKHALLEALISQMLDDVLVFLAPIIEDPALDAREKFKRYFDSAARWKSARREMMLALMQGWYQDDNVMVREKMRTATLKRLNPVLAAIIQQGKAEGVFNTGDPENMGEVVLILMAGMSDSMAHYFLEPGEGSKVLYAVEKNLEAYTSTLERVLGAPTGSLVMFEKDTLKEWFQPVGETA